MSQLFEELLAQLPQGAVLLPKLEVFDHFDRHDKVAHLIHNITRGLVAKEQAKLSLGPSILLNLRLCQYITALGDVYEQDEQERQEYREKNA